MVRLAILGCGEHSRSSHAAPLARYAALQPGEIELVSACDLNLNRAAEFCQTFGFARAYDDVEKMLASEKIDGCVCVMPMEQIVPTAMRLLELRIPCVIEKPLGTSLAEAENLARVARETATPHMVSVNRRFIPYLNDARKWISETGPLNYIRATQVRHARDEPDFIWSTAIHVLDALRGIAGEIRNFETDVQRRPGSPALWYVISLRFESGIHGQIEILPTAGMVEESYDLFGEGFRARVTAGSGTQRSLECWRDGQKVVDEKTSDDLPEDLRNGAYQEVEEFVRALRTGARPRPEIEDILPSARVCFAIAESVALQSAQSAVADD
jgi:predicted dehydrogenase